jgi:hypothetical protein
MTAQQRQSHIPVEIQGYVTDPKLVGYQILTNYESTYWRRLVGSDAWSLYEVLRSFCYEGNSTCHPSINLLVEILGLKQRRVLTGWITKVKGKEYRYPGLIEVLQQHELVVAEVEGDGPMMRYLFHVNLTPGLLTGEQLAQLPGLLQRKHADLIGHCKQAIQELEAKRRPAKVSKEAGDGHFKGYDKLSEGGYDKLSEGSDKLSDKQYPHNNTHRTTVVVGKLVELKIERDKAQELAANFTPEHIEEKIEFLKWKLELQVQGKTRGRPIEDEAGWLIRAIENDYRPPAAFKTQAQQKQEVAERHRRQEEAARQEAKRLQREQAEREKERQQRAQRLEQLKQKHGAGSREERLWSEVVAELETRESKLNRAKLRGLLANSTLLSLKGGQALIVIRSWFAKDQVVRNWGQHIQHALSHRLAQEVSLQWLALDRRKSRPGG